MIQGILASEQFVVFIISLILVIRHIMAAQYDEITTWPIDVKIGFLFLIMVTGTI